MKRKIIFYLLLIVLNNYVITGNGFAQHVSPVFTKAPLDSIGVTCYQMLCSPGGFIYIGSSIGLLKMKGRNVNFPPVAFYDSSGLQTAYYYLSGTTRAIATGLENMCYYATHDNNILFILRDEYGIGWPSFHSPLRGQTKTNILCLWIDSDTTLYIGTEDNFYSVRAVVRLNLPHFAPKFDRQGNRVISQGELPVKKSILGNGIKVYSFAQDSSNQNNILVGTNNGIFTYNKATTKTANLFADSIRGITVTHLECDKSGNIWFSTLEKGMGYYYKQNGSTRFYAYDKKNKTSVTPYPVANFCRKSPDDFFVSVQDSVPAIFNTKSRTYIFFDDPVFHQSPNKTSDIKIDKDGNLFVIKGGSFYYCNTKGNDLFATAVNKDSLAGAPFIYYLKSMNGEEIASFNWRPEYLKEIDLPYSERSLIVYYDVNDYVPKNQIQFAWKSEGITNGWINMPTFNIDTLKSIYVDGWKPGKYILQIKVKVGNEDWRKQEARLIIIVHPPYWYAWWFWVAVVTVISLLVGFIVNRRVKAVRKQERVKAQYEKEAMELEAKALRAQMNPHFIFNCMNSIKSLIQQKDADKAVVYLTTFSKLIRTIFQNSDTRDISLFDEIETCRLYMQLESMRFDKKFSYTFHVDELIDTKSVQVPALILQPFIENAIWHGIMPKEGRGHISVSIEKKQQTFCCIVDDNGIGREMSQQNKSPAELSTHHSKGVYLAKSRLDIDNILSDRNATVDIIDKKDEMGKSMGTKVILTFNEY